VVTGLERKVDPPRDEAPGVVSVRDDQDVCGFRVLRRVCLFLGLGLAESRVRVDLTYSTVDLSDLGNDAVHSVAHLLRRFSGGFTWRASTVSLAVPPDPPVVPNRPFGFLFPDILGEHSLVLSVVPFGDVGVGGEDALVGLVVAEKLRSGLSLRNIPARQYAVPAFEARQ